MLKRIKVRGKLLLLLATPLVAVMIFAYTGIVDRTERTTFQEGEARLAELADAGSDLSLAIQVERIRVLESERLGIGSAEDISAERAETDAQLERWIDALAGVRGDLAAPDLVADLEDLAERLPSTISPDRGTDSVTGTLLASAGRAVDDVTVALAGEAEDLDLFRALSNLNLLIDIQSSYATITSVGSEAVLQGQMSAVAATLVADAERTAQNSIDSFNQSAEPRYVEGLERLQNTGVLPNPASGPVDAVADVRDAVRTGGEDGALDWLRRGETQLTSLNGLIDNVIADATDIAQQEATLARDEARSFLVLAASVILLALVMAIIIGRSISRPLIRLTRSAEQLSHEELPALVESMRSAGRAETAGLTPIEATGRDEVAQLATAISEIQKVTIEVAEEQGDLLRRGISDIFVNLARRNQSLLDRQIDFIDQLESREESPDQLENLFRLDHLATRMRRNAESLLVLAGADPTRRRGRPVAIIDVLRVAMGEIEDFSRIELTSVDGSTVAGSVAVDLAHLMSELMENATQFSPPEAPVEAVGERLADDSYRLTLTDRGIGMSAEQIATANTTLAEPPLIGLDLSRSLGFTVVSRLAHRLGVNVTLSAGVDGGVTAVVAIPAEMIGSADAGEDAPLTSPVATDIDLGVPSTMDAAAGPPDHDTGIETAAVLEATHDHETTSETGVATPLHSVPDAADEPTRDNPWGRPTPDAAADESSGDPTSDSAATEPAVVDGPAPLPTRRPAERTPAESPAPAAPLAAVPPAEASPGPIETDDDNDLFAAFGTPAGVPSVPEDPSVDLFAPIDALGSDSDPVSTTSPADAVTEPTPTTVADSTPPEAGVAAAPLPSRDPAAIGAVSPQVTSAGLIRRTPKRVDVPEESKYAAAAPGPAGPPAATTPTATRSPEEVRQMLSRYRAGLRKGRTPEPDGDRTNRPS